MTTDAPGPRHLTKGGNIALVDLGADLGGVTVLLDSRGRDGDLIDADISVLLLGQGGQVRSGDDFVFYNQPIALGGAVHLRDKVRPALGSEEAADGWSSDVITLELDDVTDEVARVVIAASVDPSTGLTFGDAAAIRMRVQRTADAVDLVVFDIDDASTERALLFGEFYRRDGGWRVRAIGQGYADGLAALVADYGVEVDAEPDVEPDAEPDLGAETEASGEPGHHPPREDEQEGAPQPQNLRDGGAPSLTSAAPSSPDDSVGEQSAAPVEGARRGVSVRRPSRPPRLPVDWNASIPADEGNDWQPARLFPVAGIGGGEEQERRATSALLAVMAMVREFGAALTMRCGAPRGVVTTYVEVPFGQGEEAYRPDGVIQVTWGKRTWTGLVEVKTSTGRLRAEQIAAYIGIARARGYDAVITISNELTGGDSDHPVAIDRRTLRKVGLHHLSWDQIRADAVLVARHRGVADPTQRAVLEEFIRYMAHGRSGMGGLGDMGPGWVTVRDGVKAKTARPSDTVVGEVSARFDELIQHVGHHMSALLGVEVQTLTPRETPDHASRRQQLADSGLLFGRIKVPGAVDVVVVGADLRADKATASITVPAPRGETRPLTRISWLVRQLPEDASDAIRIEAQVAGPRATSTAALLGKVRTDPSCLVPDGQREIRAFTLSLDHPMGAKRAAGTGALVSSIKGVTTTFYADVVQHLRPWVDKRG